MLRSENSALLRVAEKVWKSGRKVPFYELNSVVNRMVQKGDVMVDRK